MAQKTMTILEDDIEGGEASQTISFSLDGTSYEIDLNDKNASSLREAFASWVGHARKSSGGGRSVAVKKSGTAKKASGGASNTGEIREWLKSQGQTVSDRGRISAEHKDMYDKAHA